MAETKTPQEADYGKVLVSWEVPEYAHHEKNTSWYLVAGIIVLAIIVYGLITAEYTMVVAFALLAGVYYVLHNEPPKNMWVKITTLGVIVDRDFYQFSELANFWIVYNPPEVKVLYLRPVKKLATDIKIELVDQNPMVLRQLLQTQVAEIAGEGESMIDKMTRWLKL